MCLRPHADPRSQPTRNAESRNQRECNNPFGSGSKPHRIRLVTEFQACFARSTVCRTSSVVERLPRSHSLGFSGYCSDATVPAERPHSDDEPTSAFHANMATRATGSLAPKPNLGALPSTGHSARGCSNGDFRPKLKLRRSVFWQQRYSRSFSIRRRARRSAGRCGTTGEASWLGGADDGGAATAARTRAAPLLGPRAAIGRRGVCRPVRRD